MLSDYDPICSTIRERMCCQYPSDFIVAHSSFQKAWGHFSAPAKFSKNIQKLFFLCLFVMRISSLSPHIFQYIRFGDYCTKINNTYLLCYVSESNWYIVNVYLITPESSWPFLLQVLMLYSLRWASRSVIFGQRWPAWGETPLESSSMQSVAYNMFTNTQLRKF